MGVSPAGKVSVYWFPIYTPRELSRDIAHGGERYHVVNEEIHVGCPDSE